MTILSQRDLFPLIAESIRTLWSTKHDWIHRDEIVDELLRKAEVRERLAASLPSERDPRWYVGNAVDWFSQKFTAGESDYISAFVRARSGGKWTYRPLESTSSPEPEVKTYTKFEELGRGGFGVVYRGELAVNGQLRGNVAIKTYLRDFDEAEYGLLRELDHPYIVKLIDRFDDRDLRGNAYTCIVLEYADGGSLAARIRMTPHGLPAGDVWQMTANVAHALQYLHSREPRVLHRDVKPDNILYCNGIVKLSDVGIAKLVDTTTVTHSGVQTLAFAAPEMFPLHPGIKPIVSPKVDVYALGLTAYMALTGDLPWRGAGAPAIMWHHHNSTLPPHPNITDEAYRVLLGMTAKRYEDRWTAAEVVKHAELFVGS